ncbi:MAG: thioredoxin family protein [Rhodoferax sp.]
MTDTPELWAVCLCAQWCTTCAAYAHTFAQVRHHLAPAFGHARFVWIDIEDDADLIDPLDVENFPTLLVSRGAQALFFGPLTPQPETLQRLLQALWLDPQAPALTQPEVTRALTRIIQAHTGGSIGSIADSPRG